MPEHTDDGIEMTHVQVTEGDESDAPEAGGPGSEAETSPRCQRVRSFLFKWHLPIGLIAVVVFGLLYPPPGAWLANNTPLSTICVVIIFLISGINLQTDEIVQALRDWPALIAGLVLILGVTPLVGLLIQLIPLESVAVLNGLALFFAMPTTISSGVVLTEQARGSKALALFFSVVTNLLAVFTCAPFLALLLRAPDGGGGASGTIDVVAILWRLTLTVVLPLVVGKAMRAIPTFPARAKAWKAQTKLASSLFLILIPWMKVSEASSDIGLLSGGTIGAIIGIGAGTHVVLLVVCTAVSLALPIVNSNRKAIIISGSQKTIAIAAAFLALLPESMSPGIMVIPAIVSHFAQIVIDALVATWLVSFLPSEDEGAEEADGDAADGEDTALTPSSHVDGAAVAASSSSKPLN